MTVAKTAVLTLFSVLLVVGGYVSHLHLEESRAAMPALQRFTLLPDGEILRSMSLGYHDVLADLFWLQAIQDIGENKISVEEGRGIYRAMDVATTLDPRFMQAYEVGGIALCTVVVLPQESNRLLEKGMRNFPEEWKFPFLLGINYYFELSDDAKAGDYMASASRMKGAPPYLSGFASRLLISTKEPQVAIDFLSHAYEEAEDDQIKSVLEYRLKEAAVERDLQLLESALSKYQQRHGDYPRVLGELVKGGVLTGLPVEPMGGQYIYDPISHNVRSTSMNIRLSELPRNRRQQ